jgi:hypothetical protein
MTESAGRRIDILRKVGGLVAALLISYAFVLTLMTASSQAGVAGRLAKLNPPVEYSAGYAAWQESERGTGRLQASRNEALRLTYMIEDATENERRARDAYMGSVTPILALASRFEANPACRINVEATAPEEVAATVARLRLCLPDLSLSPAARQAIANLLAGDPLPGGSRWAREKRRKELFERRLAAVQADVERQASQARELSERFSELSALRHVWLPGGSILMELPPSMIQILLAFVAGMFGALLITLVLIVYPRHLLTPVSQAKGHAARILLGGLISLCVFVVVGGGTAVLGASTAFAGGQANFLAFCSIGILAGMFSDRVAAWLSERADTFFRRGEKPEDPPDGTSETKRGDATS